MRPVTPGSVVERFAAILVVFGFVSGIAVALAFFGIVWLPFSVAGTALMLVASWWTSPGRRFDPYRVRAGVDGETLVGWTIDELRAFAYEIVNGVMGARGNVDHIVVGPTGVFAIETKNWTGRVELQNGLLINNGRACADEVHQTLRTRWPFAA